MKLCQPFKIRDLRIGVQVMSGDNNLQFSQTSVKYGHDLEKSKRRTIWQDMYGLGFLKCKCIYEHEFLVLNIWTFTKCRKLRLLHPRCKLSCSNEAGVYSNVIYCIGFVHVKSREFFGDSPFAPTEWMFRPQGRWKLNVNHEPWTNVPPKMVNVLQRLAFRASSVEGQVGRPERLPNSELEFTGSRFFVSTDLEVETP